MLKLSKELTFFFISHQKIKQHLEDSEDVSILGLIALHKDVLFFHLCWRLEIKLWIHKHMVSPLSSAALDLCTSYRLYSISSAEAVNISPSDSSLLFF